MENPSFAIDFFFQKTMKQWANETHGVFWGINSYYNASEHPEAYWVQNMKTMQYKEWLLFMGIHESVVYAILLLYCIALAYMKKTKRKIDSYQLVPIVTFIGGFLFSLIWEGQTSAVMCYPIYVIPIALAFICELPFLNIVWSRCTYNDIKYCHDKS